MNKIINKSFCEKVVKQINKKIIAIIVLVCGIAVCFGHRQGKEIQQEEEAVVANLNITNVRDTVPKVALTFDDGPSGAYTEILLKGLKKRGIKATFFVTGQMVENNKKIIKKMYKSGHLIGNHTYTHADLAKTSYNEAKKEIENTNNLIQEITGEMPKYIRPPYGDWNEQLLKETDMAIVLWSVDPEDWKDQNADIVAKRVIKSTEPGDIILLHDIFKTSVEAAFRIIDELQAKGYQFVTIDKLDSNKIIINNDKSVVN